MNITCLLALLALLALSTLAASAAPAGMATEPDEIPLRIGGCGGVYFLASPGELVVDVEKRDRNLRGARTDLRALLLGPDRAVLGEATLADDGQARGSGPGPAKRARLTARVERTGIYALNITVSNDRYGDDILWGFRANCKRYLIETSRGHRDERRQEPLVLLNPGQPGDVCFLPRPGAFGIEVSGLPAAANALPVYDGQGALVATLQADATGRAAHAFPADTKRGAAPWRLHLPAAQAKIQIDGVTRWDAGDPYPDLPLWSPDPASFFPFADYRWLLTPYSRVVYGKPGQAGHLAFQVRNNSGKRQTVRLSLEFPGAAWPLRLSAGRVGVGAKKTAAVEVSYAAPPQGEERVAYVRATPEGTADFTTYSTVTVRGGEAPAAKPLPLPLVLKPYRHENEQLGYLQGYPGDWEPYFDLKNRPFVRTNGGLAARREEGWSVIDWEKAAPARPAGLEGASFATDRSNSKVAFDRDGDVYVLTAARGQAVLLHSSDEGRTFAAYSLGRSGGLDIEQFSGHNVPDGPPPILRSIETAADPKRIWRRINDLELFLPRKENGRLVIGEPILISRQSLGVGSHSGIASAVVSRGSKVHVVWAEATDPEEKVPGAPTYVATYDRETRTLGKPALVGYGPPPNDIHNRPSITLDSQGYLHALTGTHGAPFQYARSLKPNDANSGWTPAESVGAGLSQTYIGMVCGPDDTLYLAFRLWRNDPAYHPSGASYGTLATMRKRPGRPWEAPRVLVVPPFSEYSIYYHRLTIDRAGRLYLSYDYWSTYWFYRTDHPGDRRALMTSSDGGETWAMAGL